LSDRARPLGAALCVVAVLVPCAVHAGAAPAPAPQAASAPSSSAASSTPSSSASAASSSPAPAASSSTPADDRSREAARLFKLGTDLYDEGNYSGALAEFRKAYELTGAFRVLYNIGQLCYQLQDYVCALTSLEAYLEKGGDAVPDDRRALVRADIASLRPRIGTVVVRTNVPGVLISIDDLPRGATPLAPIRLSVGAHRIYAVRENKVPMTQTIFVAGGEAQTVPLDLVDAVAAPTGSRATTERPPTAPPSRWTTLSFVGLGASLALAVGAGITGGLALGASSDLEKQRYAGPPSDEAKSLQSRVSALRLTSDLLTGGALVTLGVTLYFTLRPRAVPETSAGSVSLSVGPNSASLRGSF
jgi:hypothetical protein